MARVPDAGVMVTSPKTLSALQAEEEQRRKAVEQMPGAALDATYTIASGAFKPTVGVFAVDTEGGAATDDLDRITGEPDVTLAGFPGHGIVFLRAAHTDRTVVVKHLAGGSYDISLAFSASFALDSDRKGLALQLRGTRWYEIDREYGGDLAARRADLGVALLSQLPNPASPGDNGKYVGASSGSVAWTQIPPGGDGFIETSLHYPDSTRLYSSGEAVRFDVDEGDPNHHAGLEFPAPLGATLCRIQCMAEISTPAGNYDSVKLLVATKRFEPTVQAIVYDGSGLVGARGLPARTVFYRTEADAETNPYVAIASSIVPVIANGAVRVQLLGRPSSAYSVKGGKARAWLSLQWM